MGKTDLLKAWWWLQI